MNTALTRHDQPILQLDGAPQDTVSPGALGRVSGRGGLDPREFMLARMAALRAVLAEYQVHYNTARPHQGIAQRVPTTNATLIP
jgi:Integrase core domain